MLDLYGDELARLDLACQFAHLAFDFLESAPLIVDDQLQQLQQRFHDAQQENADTHEQTVPHRQEVPESRGGKVVNVEQGFKDKFWMPLQERVTTMSTIQQIQMYDATPTYLSVKWTNSSLK